MALLPVIDLACCNVMPCEHQVLFYFKTMKKISFVHIDLFSEFLSSNFDYFFSLLETYIILFFNKIRVGLRLRTVHICIFGYTVALINTTVLAVAGNKCKSKIPLVGLSNSWNLNSFCSICNIWLSLNCGPD